MMIWSESDKAIIKSRIEAGERPSKIALDFKTTRNAIIGLKNRNGWISPHKKVVRPKVRYEPRVEIKRMRIASPNYIREVAVSEAEAVLSTAEFDAQIPVSQRKRLLELEPHDCKWPCGNPQDEGFFFCAAEALPGRPYCAFHFRASVQPSGGGKFALRKWATSSHKGC